MTAYEKKYRRNPYRNKKLYRMYQRLGGTWYAQNNVTGQQQSLKTSDKDEAERILNGLNEAALPVSVRTFGRFVAAVGTLDIFT